MKQLYKGKYLVVIYDRKGNIKRVMSDIPREQITFISHVFNGTIKANNVEFIDVFEEHDDCFSEEDKIEETIVSIMATTLFKKSGLLTGFNRKDFDKDFDTLLK